MNTKTACLAFRELRDLLYSRFTGNGSTTITPLTTTWAEVLTTTLSALGQTTCSERTCNVAGAWTVHDIPMVTVQARRPVTIDIIIFRRSQRGILRKLKRTRVIVMIICYLQVLMFCSLKNYLMQSCEKDDVFLDQIFIPSIVLIGFNITGVMRRLNSFYNVPLISRMYLLSVYHKGTSHPCID